MRVDVETGPVMEERALSVQLLSDGRILVSIDGEGAKFNLWLWPSEAERMAETVLRVLRA